MPKEDRCVLGLKHEGTEEERKGLSNACYSKGSNEASTGEGPIFLLKEKQIKGNGGGACDGHPSNRDSATEPRNTRIEARQAL